MVKLRITRQMLQSSNLAQLCVKSRVQSLFFQVTTFLPSIVMVKTTRPNKPDPSRQKSNASGDKRQSRKAATKKPSNGFSDNHDVYEYKSEKVRHSNVKLDLAQDEAAEFGEDSVIGIILGTKCTSLSQWNYG